PQVPNYLPAPRSYDEFNDDLPYRSEENISSRIHDVENLGNRVQQERRPHARSSAAVGAVTPDVRKQVGFLGKEDDVLSLHPCRQSQSSQHAAFSQSGLIGKNEFSVAQHGRDTHTDSIDLLR